MSSTDNVVPAQEPVDGLEVQDASKPCSTLRENCLKEEDANTHDAVRKSASPPSSRHTPHGSPPKLFNDNLLPDDAIPIDPALVTEQVDAGVVTGQHEPGVAQGDPATRQTSPHGSPPHVAALHMVSEQGETGAPRDERPAQWGSKGPGLLIRTDSQSTESQSPSPATPLGLGREGLYRGRLHDLSRQSSMSDFGSLLGATKGSDTPDGSEMGDAGSVIDGGTGSEFGVPPPKDRPKKSHARKQPEGHIKRARNAFILFRKHITDSNLIPSSVEVKHQNISVVAAKMWREASPEVRQQFQEQARIEKEEHQRKYPGYRYQPVFRRTDIIRRRVRKDPAEDEKVDAVADALIKGKAGDALEKDIKEQMTTRSEVSESDVETSSRTSRRRRRDAGQLSKGALRAQRAQARAKQMRQNLLGSNILSMSMYNAAQAANRQSLNHPGAQHYMQYAPAEQYLPVGYEMDPNHMGYPDQGMYPGGMDGGEMYRLPPMDGMGMEYDAGWTQGAEYWSGPEGMAHGDYAMTQAMGQQATGAVEFYQGMPTHPMGHEYGVRPEEVHQHPHVQPPHLGPVEIGHEAMHDYRLPPLAGPSSVQPAQPAQLAVETTERRDPRVLEWAREGQQTPSGHVVFNERLFDGALGSATLPSLEVGDELAPRDEGLAGFDEAIAQAGEMDTW